MKHTLLGRSGTLQQGDLSVVEFASLVRRIAATPGLEDIRNSETSLIHRFRYRLRSALQDKLLLQEFATLEECVSAADRAEQALAQGYKVTRLQIRRIFGASEAHLRCKAALSKACINKLCNIILILGQERF